MDLHETLLSYSFWLSDQDVLTPANRNDPRTHDDLVQEFLTQLAASTRRVGVSSGTEHKEKQQ